MLSHVQDTLKSVSVDFCSLCILVVQKTLSLMLPLWPVLHHPPSSLHTACGTVKSQTNQETIIDEMNLLWP